MAKKPEPIEPTATAPATGLTPAQPADSLPEPPAVLEPQPPQDLPSAVEQAEQPSDDAPTDEELVRQGAVVICPYHKQRCRANGTTELITKYYCPVAGCNFSQHVPRPKLRDYLLGGRRRNEDDDLPLPR